LPFFFEGGIFAFLYCNKFEIMFIFLNDINKIVFYLWEKNSFVDFLVKLGVSSNNNLIVRLSSLIGILDLFSTILWKLGSLKFVLVSLAQLVWTMHKIWKVWVQTPATAKEKKLSFFFSVFLFSFISYQKVNKYQDKNVYYLKNLI